MATKLEELEGYQKIKTSLLHLIRWKDQQGKMEKLHLYTVLSTMWEKVSDLLELDPPMRQSIADKNNRDPEKCIRDVIERWMQDEKSLSSNYKCTWNGLCSLLEDINHGTKASELRAALAAGVSSFNNNLDEEVTLTKPQRVKKWQFYSSSSTKFITPSSATELYGGTLLSARRRRRNLKFPGLNLEPLNEEKREKLKLTLCQESYTLAMKFLYIEQKFYSYLEEKSMDSMAAIQALLNSCLKFPPLYDEDKYDNKLRPFTSDITIQDISDFIGQHCSFFNYDIVKIIFMRINYQDGLESLQQHDRDLEEYAKKRICHFPSGVGMTSNYVVVAVKLDDQYEGCNIIHLLDFHKKLCDILKVDLGQFTLDGLQPGCICIIFHLLSHLLDIVFPLSDEAQEKLKETNCHTARITHVSCENFIYDFEDENLKDISDELEHTTLHKPSKPYLEVKKQLKSQQEVQKGEKQEHPWKKKEKLKQLREAISDVQPMTKKLNVEMKSAGLLEDMDVKLQHLGVEQHISKLPVQTKPKTDYFEPECLQTTSTYTTTLDLQKATVSTLPLQLDWRRGPDMPVAMCDYIKSIEINGTVYVGGGDTDSVKDYYIVMAYNTQSCQWHTLPPYSTRWFAMTVFNNKLVLVGGKNRDDSDSSELGVWQSDGNQWTRPFPPMSTPRWDPSATSYKHWLVVAGGCHGYRLQASVEVLDVSNMQWSTGPSTPIRWRRMKSTTIGDTWYLTGGKCGDVGYGPDVYSVSLESLVSQSSSHSSTIWRKLPPLNCRLSCPLNIGGSLLAVGGYDMTSHKPVSTIQRYVPNTWVQAGQLPHAVRDCTCIMTSDKIHVMEGQNVLISNTLTPSPLIKNK